MKNFIYPPITAVFMYRKLLFEVLLNYALIEANIYRRTALSKSIVLSCD